MGNILLIQTLTEIAPSRRARIKPLLILLFTSHDQPSKS